MNSSIKIILFGFTPPVALCALLVYSLGKIPDEKPMDPTLKERAKLFCEITDMIQENYVLDTPSDELFIQAVRGMMKSLHYSSIEEAKQFNSEISGKYVGLGLYCHQPHGPKGGLFVYKTRWDSPAYYNLTPGDRILAIDGKSTEGMSIDEAYELMRGDGKKGSKCLIKWLDKKSKREDEFPIERALIRIPSAYGERMLDPKAGIGYIRISHFTQVTHQEFKHILDGLKEEHQGNLKALILDLRFNLGGILDSAVKVANIFLLEGIIVTTRGRAIDSKKIYSASRAMCSYPKINLAVLINQESASAAEVLAGALQDHKRAVLLGEHTFGKGAIQTAVTREILGKSMVLKIPTALYYLPSGRCIDKKFAPQKGHMPGLRPDMVVPLPKGEQNQVKQTLFDLSFPEEKEHSIGALDVQVKAAIDLLNGRTVFSPLPKDKKE